MKGSQIAVNCLKEQGVKCVFGYPGASVLSFIDSLTDSGIKLFCEPHEQLCVHAAEGYAKSSDKIGVVIATSGPGATNLVTGIADAYMDSVPLVAITGNVPLSLLGRDAFQETDIAGVTMPITKHNIIVKSIKDLAPSLRLAFAVAGGGRKGPVLVDIPRDIFEAEAPYKRQKPIYPSPQSPKADDINIACELINNAKNPVICAGGGVIASNASKSLKALAEALDCHVLLTAMGIGAYPQSDSRFGGTVGTGIAEHTEKILEKSDLLIAVGIRFSERLVANIRRYAPECQILHIDIDEAEIGKNLVNCVGLCGDANETINLLLPAVLHRERKIHTSFPHKKGLLFEIYKAFPQAIFTTEVGLHQLCAIAELPLDAPRSFITSGGLGTMGFGLPAAVGAAIANPKKTIINLAGDGSFNMNIPELFSVVQRKLPILQIVFNNRSLGMIKKWQRERFDGRVSVSQTPNADYVKIAQAFGMTAISVDNAAKLQDALNKAKETLPMLIEIKTADYSMEEL